PHPCARRSGPQVPSVRASGRGDCPQSPWVRHAVAWGTSRTAANVLAPNPGRLRITAPTFPPTLSHTPSSQPFRNRRHIPNRHKKRIRRRERFTIIPTVPFPVVEEAVPLPVVTDHFATVAGGFHHVGESLDRREGHGPVGAAVLDDRGRHARFDVMCRRQR